AIVSRTRVREARRAAQVDVPGAADPAPERAAQGAARDDVAEGVHALLRSVDDGGAQAAALGDGDARGGARPRRDLVPDADAFEDPPAAAGDRDRALVEGGLRVALERHGFDEEDLDRKLPERPGQARADQAAAGDDDVVGLVAHAADPTSASISS